MSRVDFSAAFEALSPGRSFTTRGRTITEADVVGFAAITGDWHPQHSDAAWASESTFGERIAHGMLVVSYAVGLLPIDPDRVVALRRLTDIVFKRPVRIGDTMHVEGQIAAKRPVTDDTGLVTLDIAVKNQRDELACRGRIDALWRRDAPPAQPAVLPEPGFVPIPL